MFRGQIVIRVEIDVKMGFVGKLLSSRSSGRLRKKSVRGKCVRVWVKAFVRLCRGHEGDCLGYANGL